MNTWGTALGLMIYLFLMRPFKTDTANVVKSIMFMGTVGIGLRIISVGTLTDWTNKLGEEVAAPAIAGSAVLVGLNFAIKKADIPFVSDKLETVIQYLLYAVGGSLMAGSAEWGALFTDAVGLLGGGKNTGGFIGIAEDILHLLTLGLRNQ